MFACIDPSIDVRLLRTTLLILRERSVSRVALHLGHSQPAVSASLKRARVAFGDPLLVRSGQSMVLTDRGREVEQAIDAVLHQLQGMITAHEAFDPQTSQRHIRIGAVNCFGTFLIPAIGSLLRREAPGATLEFLAPRDFGELASDMAGGAVDLVIGNWPSPQESLRSSTLLTGAIACLLHRDHPLAQQAGVDLETYLAHDHLSPSPHADALYSPIDGRLAQLGLSRRIAMSVTEYGLVPPLLRDTGLVFTSAQAYVRHLAAAPDNADLRAIAAPPEFGVMSLYLLWHEQAHTSPFNQWLRRKVREVARSIGPAHAETRAAGAAPAIIVGEAVSA